MKLSLSITGKILKQWLPFIIILSGIFCFFYFRIYHYFSFETLQKYHQFLLDWTQKNYLLAVIFYISFYIAIVSFSIPGGLFMTILGGFLFGIGWGSVYVVISATIGASIIFLIIKNSLGNFFAEKANPWIQKMQSGFKKNAFNYLLALRLIPIFPFWVVNIISGCFNISLRNFIVATFLGIIPVSVIYVSVGNGLNYLLARGGHPDLKIIFQPVILFPLCGLGLLALLPVIYKKYQAHKNKNFIIK